MSLIHIDVAPVHESDAVRLMVYHLRMAASLFEATPDTLAPAYAEIARQFEGHAPSAARAFVENLDAFYSNLDQGVGPTAG